MSFVDYYEVLEVSPNANSETIERMFRYMAHRFHPDNQDTGDRDRFDLVLEAHNALRDPARRAQYDVEHKRQSGVRTQLAEEASDSEGIDRDAEMQNKLLSLFYVRRRKDVRNAGIGDAELAALLDCPHEHLEFHLWYLREKKWIAKNENGMFAITIDGVDRASSEHHVKAAAKLLTDQS